MEKTFQTLNELRSAGVIANHVISGAFALSFFSEPVVTFDQAKFDAILEQHHLQAGWQKFQTRFL